MKKVTNKVVILFFLILGTHSAISKEAQSSVQNLYTTFTNSQDEWRSKGTYSFRKNISQFYDSNFSPMQKEAILDKMGIADLHIMFDAAYDATFYTYNENYLDELRKDYSILQARDAALSGESEQLFRALVRLRKLDAAQSFLSLHPGIKVTQLPAVLDLRTSKNESSELFVDKKSDTLYLRNVSIRPLGPQVIVVGHPLCHFTQNAVVAIRSNPTLRKILEKNSIWISPQDGYLDVAEFRKWNSSDDFHISITWKEAQWSKIDQWDTPTFYFFLNGSLKAKVVGWPKGGNEKALTNGLKAIGLM